MTTNSTATSKWGSTHLESITPVHHVLHQAGFRTGIVLMPTGAYLTDEEHDKLTEIGLGLKGFRDVRKDDRNAHETKPFRGIRNSLKHERIFVDFEPTLSDAQITNLVRSMLHQMSVFADETPAQQQSSTPAVQFSS